MKTFSSRAESGRPIAVAVAVAIAIAIARFERSGSVVLWQGQRVVAGLRDANPNDSDFSFLNMYNVGRLVVVAWTCTVAPCPSIAFAFGSSVLVRRWRWRSHSSTVAVACVRRCRVPYYVASRRVFVLSLSASDLFSVTNSRVDRYRFPPLVSRVLSQAYKYNTYLPACRTHVPTCPNIFCSLDGCVIDGELINKK